MGERNSCSCEGEGQLGSKEEEERATHEVAVRRVNLDDINSSLIGPLDRRLPRRLELLNILEGHGLRRREPVFIRNRRGRPDVLGPSLRLSFGRDMGVNVRTS